jgi:hypothetical protein
MAREAELTLFHVVLAQALKVDALRSRKERPTRLVNEV